MELEPGWERGRAGRELGQRLVRGVGGMINKSYPTYSPPLPSPPLPPPHTQNQQIRGPYSHPIIGFIPTDGYHNAAIQLGMMLAYGGYLTCGMMTISAALTVINWGYIFLVICCEFALFLGLQASRGRVSY